MTGRFTCARLAASLFFAAVLAGAVSGQNAGFSFQGRLNDGSNPANGNYDLLFRLFDAPVGGNQVTQTLSRPNTTLINGVFSVTLDFGDAVFSSTPNLYIEIGVRPGGSANAYTTLGPRQHLTVAPLAWRAATASQADSATNATHAFNADLAINAGNALNFDGLPSSGYAKLNVVNTGDLRTTGVLAITANAFQPITANGFVKAMLYVQQNGTILRCYNGITNLSTGTCGFTINHAAGTGVYHLGFDFRVDDRFLSATARNPTVVQTFVSASFQFITGNPNAVDVITFITNAGTTGGDEANFMLVIY
jgi:hypothetical protein